MDRVGEYDPESVKRFRRFSLAAMEVSAAGLKELKSMLGEGAITADKILGPNLSDSVPLTGATAVNNGGYAGADTVVAVLDTGVDAIHPMFEGKVVTEACFSTTSVSNNSTTLCPNGLESHIGDGAGIHCPPSVGGCDHGTHVAGIVAGRASTLSGVAREAGIVSIQVYSRFDGSICNSFGMTSPCALSYTSDQIQALEHVLSLSTDYPVAAVNLSLGGGRYLSAAACDTDPDNVPYREAVETLRTGGIATVAAAGNDAYTDAVNFPACLSDVVSVGSTTKSDVVAQSSNNAPWVSVLAPGDDITSARAGGGYQVKSGTSMAAPHVAGAWAALKSKWRGASVEQILSSLVANGTSVNDPRTGLVLPRIQLDEAIFEYLAVSPGLNLVGIDVSESEVFDSFALLPRLGGHGEVNRLQALNSGDQSVDTTYYDNEGEIAGSNVMLDMNDTGWLVYAAEPRLLKNDNHDNCSAIQLDRGVNLVAFPCMRFERTAYDILEEMASSVNSATVQAFNTRSGRIQTAILSQDGVPVGSNFSIDNSKAYFLEVDTAVWISAQ
jgi:subtilisin family serine protease